MGPSNSCELAKHQHHPSDGRSDTLLANPAGGFEVIHDDGSDQPQEHSVKLDGRIRRTRWRTIDVSVSLRQLWRPIDGTDLHHTPVA